MSFQHILDQLVCRRVAYGDKHTLCRDAGNFASRYVLDLDPLDTKWAIAAMNLFQLVEPRRVDLWIFHQPVNQDLFGT